MGSSFQCEKKGLKKNTATTTRLSFLLSISSQRWRMMLPSDKHALIAELKYLAHFCGIHRTMHLHSHIVESGIAVDAHLGNTLLSVYCKSSCVDDAAKLFETLPTRSAVSWTVMTTCFAKHGLHHKVLDLYMLMESDDVELDAVTLVCLIHACTALVVLGTGKLIHADVYRHGLEDHTVIGCSILNMYAKHGYLSDARKVFDEQIEKNVVTWTSMISGYSDYGLAQDACEIFEKMYNEGAKPDQVTFQSALKACTFPETVNTGKYYHVILINAELKHTVSLDNALLNMYSKCSRLDMLSSFFQRMEKRDVASWSMVIASHVDGGHAKIALDYFMKMRNEEVKPNNVTYISILKACGNLKRLKEANIIHHNIVEDEFWADSFVASTIIDMYSRCDQIADACWVFNRSDKKDVVLWTAMIRGCAQQGFNEEALEHFHRMQINGVEANGVTFISVLCACASLFALEQGAAIHQQICKNGLDVSVNVGTALINMYSKCGQLQEAHSVLSKLPAVGVVTCTCMVVAYAHHGYGRKALELLRLMHRTGMQLDHVSFVGILAACSNAGFLTEALELFELMQDLYELPPSTKHYACMVDAFGRAGQIEEAESMLTTMPVQPNAVSRRTLLGACKNHEKMNLQDSLTKQIIYFEPEEAEDFVLLANIFSAPTELDDGGGDSI